MNRPAPHQVNSRQVSAASPRIKVPTLLRDAGLRLVTLAEHYGIPADETVPDRQWLELAGSQGWAVLMKDTRIRQSPAEREAVKTRRVRCFCLSSQSLTADAMAATFLDNLTRITAACEEPGPYIYAVHKNRIEKLTLSDL